MENTNTPNTVVLSLRYLHSPGAARPVSLPMPPHYLFMYFLRGENVPADSFKFLAV